VEVKLNDVAAVWEVATIGSAASLRLFTVTGEELLLT